MRRFPARGRRWRCWSPEEASSGAVPFQEAKWPRLANRPMAPMSACSAGALSRADVEAPGGGLDDGLAAA
jgi:hypothetical protein